MCCSYLDNTSSIQNCKKCKELYTKAASLKSFQIPPPQIEGLSGESSPGYWTTTEESIDGRCTVTYQLNQVPEYMIKDLPEIISSSERNHESHSGSSSSLCRQEGKVWELTKTKDVTSCSARSSFNRYAPGNFECSSGNCEGMSSRSSSTRYIACGDRDNLQIQTIINDGEFYSNILGVKTENFLTGTKQVLKLVKKQTISSKFVEPEEPVTVNNVLYEHVFKKNFVRSSGEETPLGKIGGGDTSSIWENEELRSELHKLIPHQIMISGGESNPLTGHSVDDMLIPQMRKIIIELVENDLKSYENLPKKMITMKVLNLARSFALCKYESVDALYQEMRSKFSDNGRDLTVFKNIFFDTLLMGGTASDIRMIKKYIENGEISCSAQIGYILMTLPQYVMVPTNKVLETLYELVTLPKVAQNINLFSVATLGYSQLIEKACLAENRHTAYPTNIYGSFCEPTSEIVVQKWIPHLASLLREQDYMKKNVAIVSLGKLSHKQVLPLLLPVIEGKMEQQSNEISLSRFLAIYSLAQPGMNYPEMVTPVLMSVYLNPGETTEVRVAAFNSLLKMSPSMTVLQQIAASTWHETDMEVLKVVTTAMYSMSKQTDVEVMTTTSSDLRRKASMIYPLMKKTEGLFPTSATIITSDYMSQLKTGYVNINNWVSSPNSFWPTSAYTKIIYFLDRYYFAPIEVGAAVFGGEQLVDLIKDSLRNPEERSAEEKLREQLSSEMKEVISKLRIETRENPTFKGALIMNFFEDATFFRSFDEHSNSMLREKIVPYLRNPSLLKEKLIGNGQLNFQRMMDLAPTEILIPSDMGLPIILEVHMPVALSITGDMDMETRASQPALNYNVQAMLAAQYTGWVGTICPFTQETLYTGLDEHAVVSIPANFRIALDTEQHKLRLTVKPIQVDRPVDLIHFHVRPYTVSQSYWNMEPMVTLSSAKVIHSQSPRQSVTKTFGGYLGLNLKSVINSESRFLDRRTVLDKLSFYNYNPLNMVRFIWASTAVSETGKPSLRMHEYQLKYEPEQGSSMSEIELELSMSYMSKVLGESFKQHLVEVDEEKHSILPYKIVKKSLSERVHPHLQEKLEKVLEKIGSIESGSGISVLARIVIKGSKPRSLTYSATYAQGQEGPKQKWNLHLEDESSSNKICMKGSVQLPRLPVWKVNEIRSSALNYHFDNDIGYGSDCQESHIKVTGTSQVSEKQKTYSRESPEAKELSKLSMKNTPLIDLSELSEKVREQASMLDQINFNIRYQGVGPQMFQVSQRVIDLMKGVWWPYLTQVEGTGPIHGPDATSNIKIQFHTERESFDVKLSNDAEKVLWQNVRLPYPFSYMFPKVAGKSVVKSAVEALAGKSVYPTCRVEGEWLKTFNNRTTHMEMDDCFHLLTADCGNQKDFAVLVRNLERDNPKESAKELQVYLKEKVDILMTPSKRHSRYSHDITVQVNHREVELRQPGKFFPIKDVRGETVAEIKRSVDGVIVLRSNNHGVILFNGYKIQVEATSSEHKSKLCGLCGSFGNKISADLTGPSKCVYSKPEIFVASYRVGSLPSKSCEPLSGKIAQELEKENEECSKFKIVRTKVR